MSSINIYKPSNWWFPLTDPWVHSLIPYVTIKVEENASGSHDPAATPRHTHSRFLASSIARPVGNSSLGIGQPGNHPKAPTPSKTRLSWFVGPWFTRFGGLCIQHMLKVHCWNLHGSCGQVLMCPHYPEFNCFAFASFR